MKCKRCKGKRCKGKREIREGDVIYSCPDCEGTGEEFTDSDLPCGCDHVDVSCDAPDCPLHASPDRGATE